MASRSVNSLLLSKDDMRRVYREHANGSGGIKIGHIIRLFDILVPIIPHFFGTSRANADSYNKWNMSYGSEDDMPYHGNGRFGIAPCKVSDSGHYGHGMAYNKALDGPPFAMGLRIADRQDHYGMNHAEDYADRIISEEEFERLLDYAEQRNHVRMY